MKEQEVTIQPHVEKSREIRIAGEYIKLLYEQSLLGFDYKPFPV